MAHLFTPTCTFVKRLVANVEGGNKELEGLRKQNAEHRSGECAGADGAICTGPNPEKHGYLQIIQ